MKLSVKTVFVDKITGRQYKVGEIIEISEKDRVDDMLSRGLAEAVEAESKPVKKRSGKNAN